MGKSSLVNAFLNEQLARVQAFKLQADTETTVSFIKEVGGWVTKVLMREGEGGERLERCG